MTCDLQEWVIRHPGPGKRGWRASGIRSRLGARSPLTPWGCLMSGRDVDVPDMLPVLSRGRHRSPRRGACFMELASHLAGRAWSDHPEFTHPLLAAVARLVNDHTSDAGRAQLVELVPTVIGLDSDDPRADARIALRAATIALPVVAADRQRVMAVSVLVSERMLADLDGRPAGELGERSRRALDQAPHAAAWARRRAPESRVPVKSFCRHTAPSTVDYAVPAIARACVPEPDEVLRELLVGAIGDCAADSRDDAVQWPIPSPPSTGTTAPVM